ncbi:hypothetical protein FJZ26_04520 [Candidatus Parvarchaeota archaeon]|nr:hypothetical protein [Candidatus Parvarchaeota archaeon]
MEIDIGAQKIVAELEGREKQHDEVISQTRPIIRDFANSIKLIHSGNISDAQMLIEAARKSALALPITPHTDYLLSPINQEYVEAKALLCVIKKEQFPSHSFLGVPFEDYLTGLCDLVGELRRQMLEELKAGKGNEAKYYFDTMSAIYEAMIPIRFSNSILPNFRRKQDVARVQVEQARSELLRHID